MGCPTETAAADDDHYCMLVVGDPRDDLRRCAVLEHRVDLDVGVSGVEGTSGGHGRRHVGMRSKLLSLEQPDGVNSDDPAPQIFS